MELRNEITFLYLGVINFIYMFLVWGLNNFMLVFASGIVGSNEIKLRQQKGVFRSMSSRRCVRVRVRRGYVRVSIVVA